MVCLPSGMPRGCAGNHPQGRVICKVKVAVWPSFGHHLPESGDEIDEMTAEGVGRADALAPQGGILALSKYTSPVHRPAGMQGSYVACSCM